MIRPVGVEAAAGRISNTTPPSTKAKSTTGRLMIRESESFAFVQALHHL
jgi:hypothetical protein